MRDNILILRRDLEIDRITKVRNKLLYCQILFNDCEGDYRYLALFPSSGKLEYFKEGELYQEISLSKNPYQILTKYLKVGDAITRKIDLNFDMLTIKEIKDDRIIWCENNLINNINWHEKLNGTLFRNLGTIFKSEL